MTQYIFLANNKIYIIVIIYYLLIFLVDDLQILSVFCSTYFPQQFWKNFHLNKGNNTASNGAYLTYLTCDWALSCQSALLEGYCGLVEVVNSSVISDQICL